ncbi:Nif3-like dinuclear metal center hexameric protein [Bordetella sp. N]|uniref:Nif3-like dinuclear metal center hexameric protein n=1 Tax=Bordetella sp. N TaxID=1746199 RepID=UPI00070ADF61|nr:Nif3-like dinuclear metal center hexameric protein [Bordetella sp. N]ALM85548.1 metal-binding protein [Bordetella sp. N]
MNRIDTHELAAWLDQTLQPARFKDYAPNGLQVEGKASVGHIIAGVTATEALLRVAIERGADALLVHHGWFWRNEDARVRGPRRTRLALTLAHDLNVFAYHLPLDAHPQLGNNAQLARVLGLEPDADANGVPRTCGRDNLIWLGSAPGIATVGELSTRIAQRLQRQPTVIGDPDQAVGRVAWCTGGAQGMYTEALDAGATVYITGEISEPSTHTARETGTTFISAGHHATERYGVQALGEAVARQFGIRVDFVDIDNPV